MQSRNRLEVMKKGRQPKFGFSCCRTRPVLVPRISSPCIPMHPAQTPCRFLLNLSIASLFMFPLHPCSSSASLRHTVTSCCLKALPYAQSSLPDPFQSAVFISPITDGSLILSPNFWLHPLVTARGNKTQERIIALVLPCVTVQFTQLSNIQVVYLHGAGAHNLSFHRSVKCCVSCSANNAS